MAHDIFISYRRSTASDAAGRLAGALQTRFGADRVFMDVSSIEQGEDFERRIVADIRAGSAMLVIIDQGWLGVVVENGTRRIEDPKDYVRREVEAALAHGLLVVPVVLDKAQLPKVEELPHSIQDLVRLNAFDIRHDHYPQDVDRLAQELAKHLPNRLVTLIDGFVEGSASVAGLVYTILAGLLMFAGYALKLLVIEYPIEVTTNFTHPAAQSIVREVGLLGAVNWWIVWLLLAPIFIVIFHCVMRDGKRLLEGFQVRKMIVYVDADSVERGVSSKSLWRAVLRPSTTFFLGIAILVVALSLYNWIKYSFGWYQPWVEGRFPLSEFLKASTGPDWNIGWEVSRESKRFALLIPGFTLAGYLLYGVTTTVVFCTFVFLFFFFGELDSITESTGRRHGSVLRLDQQDAASGGMGALLSIQKSLAWSTVLFAFSMYLMSVRNSYLPAVCRAPESMASAFPTAELLSNCQSMSGFFSRIWHSFTFFISGLSAGLLDWSTLFFSYTGLVGNDFVVGAAMYSWGIIVLFVVVTLKSIRSVTAARKLSSNQAVGARLSADLKRQMVWTAAFSSALALSTVWLNLAIPLTLTLLGACAVSLLLPRQQAA
jgi:hypothetical protein